MNRVKRPPFALFCADRHACAGLRGLRFPGDWAAARDDLKELYELAVRIRRVVGHRRAKKWASRIERFVRIRNRHEHGEVRGLYPFYVFLEGYVPFDDFEWRLEGDPWSEAAMDFERTYLVGTARRAVHGVMKRVRAETMFFAWENSPGADGKPSRDIWSEQHGFWDSVLGVFRRPVSQRLTSILGDMWTMARADPFTRGIGRNPPTFCDLNDMLKRAQAKSAAERSTS